MRTVAALAIFFTIAASNPIPEPIPVAPPSYPSNGGVQCAASSKSPMQPLVNETAGLLRLRGGMCSNCHPGGCSTIYSYSDGANDKGVRINLCSEKDQWAPVPCAAVADAIEQIDGTTTDSNGKPCHWTHSGKQLGPYTGGQNVIEGQPGGDNGRSLYVTLDQNTGTSSTC